METRKQSFISYEPPARPPEQLQGGSGQEPPIRTMAIPEHGEKPPSAGEPPIRTMAVPEHGEKPPSPGEPPIRTMAIPEHPERPPQK